MWMVVRRSIAGQGHVNAGVLCQDYSGDASQGLRRLIALADGAGSAKYAGRGAQIAVDVVLKELAGFSGDLAKIGGDTAAGWLEAVRSAIREEAIGMGACVAEFATTLLFALFDGQAAYFWQLGDGAWIVNAAGSVQVATWPYAGQYANETVFVTSETASASWVHAYFPSIVAAVGTTDGLERILLDFSSHGPHMPIMEKIFSYLRSVAVISEVEVQVEQLLSSPFVCDKSDDDKTLVVVWRPNVDPD